jgi:adenylate cyclase
MHDATGDDPFRTRQRDVTLLFADLRGFTELAATLEMDTLLCELLAHVMDCLTESVQDHHGYIVDYYGDGLVAMWNAPTMQDEHPELACRAALEMLKTLPAVVDDWIGVIHAGLRLGIGVHTGVVQLGNAGSTRHRKYGPRGPNVHVASRAEAATKELRVPLVATQSTVNRLSHEFASHRVCRALLPGLQQPTNLYAVNWQTADTLLAAAWQSYDDALRLFESGEYQEAADVLTAIDQNVAAIPLRFLTEQTKRQLGSDQRRRSTDMPGVKLGGVIALSAK